LNGIMIEGSSINDITLLSQFLKSLYRNIKFAKQSTL
jgi:hypothetical protein